MKREETLQSAREWIENGGKCRKVGVVPDLTKEQALQLLGKGYQFGMGFYELSWVANKYTGEFCLWFDEHGENYFW